MNGLMMDGQLLVSGIARHAEMLHGDAEIVSVTGDNPRHRYTYREAFARSRQLANALAARGITSGDRVGTLAWNDHRHFEIYYGVSGSGLVCHTINPRLFSDQIVYIVGHAEDRLLFVDPAFVSLVEEIQQRISQVEGFVILTDDEHMPSTSLPGAVSYESFIGAESDDFAWPEFDEKQASSLCYTSGTTGNPKGMLYTHRSTVLHSYGSALPDAFGLSSDDVVMPVVPMFHVNAWGIPYAAAMSGSKLVFPGAKMGDPAGLHELIESEGVTSTAGVPTVWQGLLDYLNETGKTVEGLDTIVSGGSAVPFSLMEDFGNTYDVDVHHAWGMTEVSPLGSLFHATPELRKRSAEEQAAARASQGLPVFGVEFRIVDDLGVELPHDNEAIGAMQVRGPWVAAGYFNNDDRSAFTDDGWFDTGDVAAISDLGYIRIADRTKDLIKSGGEWISSIELENVAVSHPEVARAAVVAMPDHKWQERPLLVVVREAGSQVNQDQILDYYADKVAKWWIPDAVAFVDEIPLTATGKISKLTLRQQLADGILGSR